MERMHHAMMVEYTGDPDVDFALGMVPHHQGAVDMAKVQLRDGKDPAMRKLAAWIITAQKQEIAEMNQWLRRKGQLESRSPVQAYAPEATAEYKEEMHSMHRGMNLPQTGNADVDFVAGMIPHHQGAVAMAATLQRYGKSPELLKLAESIIDSQRAEIIYMQKWLEEYKAGK